LTAVTLVLLFIGACSAQQRTANEELKYQYDTPGIQLEGTLVERKVYGPPGYGETPKKDERSTILILKLAHAITVEPIPDAKEKNSASLDVAKNVREVQFFLARDKTGEARAMVGKTVVAVEVLNEAVAPSQYAKVWLDVKTLSPK
jgi:hypothetical protein